MQNAEGEPRPRPKRKAIPDKVKLESVLLADGICRKCRQRLGDLKGLNFDHRPALINREVNDDWTDYVPAQLDPEYIEPTHIDCHKERTFGPGGEKRITTAGSDIHTRDKVDRLSEAHKKFQQRVLAPTPIEEPPDKSKSPKRKWASRPFPKKPPQKRASGYRRKGV